MSQSISRPLNQSIKESIEPTNPISIKDRLNIQYQETDHSFKNKVSPKKFKIIAGCGICLIIFGLLMFLAFPIFIQSQIDSQVIQKVTLTKDNQEQWAHYPGQTGTIITRNYSFFTITNEEDFLLHGKIPKFKQIYGYKLNQIQDFFDIQYNEDQTKVTMKDWLHFTEHQDTRNLQEKLKILNVPSLGYWYTLKKSRNPIIFIEGFSLMFTNIQSSIIDTVIGQGVSSQYTPDFNTTFTLLFQPAGISYQNAQFLWDDDAYGFYDKNNLKYWVSAARTSFNQNQLSFSSQALNLKDYFTLSDSQLYFILNQVKQYTQSLQNLIISNHYCEGIYNCNGRQLAIRQIAQSYVTYNTPPVSSITPTDTICQANQTCFGHYPEIAAYHKNIYLKKYPSQDPFLKFDVEMVRKWLDYNPSGKQGEYNKNQSALMHIGNLDALFNNGTLHDHHKKQFKQETQYLANIKERFQLPSFAHTRVFWEWIKYLVSELIKQSTENNQKLGMANAFSSGIYTSFIYLQDNLQLYLLKTMIKNKLSNKKCQQFLSKSFQSPQLAIKTICQNYNNSIISQQFILDAIHTCRNKFKQSWQKFQKLGVTSLNLESFCDKHVSGGFGQLYDNMRVELNRFYKCDHTPNQYCSDFELALKQWANSTVTLTHPPSAQNSLKSTTTFSSWDSNAVQFQYSHYARKFPEIQFPNFSVKEAYKMFSFDLLFSASSCLKLFKQSKSQPWKNYMRYIIIFISFRGFTSHRTAKQYMLGYNDEYLLWRKNRYPPFGGDPSTPAYTAFNDLNMTKDQVTLTIQWHTGKNNISMVGQYSKINNLTYLATNYTRFNGNQTYWVLESPWKQIDYFYGTNGKKFKPDQFGKRNVSIYVPNLQRYGSAEVDLNQKYNRYGYDIQISKLRQQMYQSQQQNPDNQKYYQNYHGAFNQTSVLGFPFFMTKHHFLNASKNWSTFIQVYDENDVRIQAVDTHFQNSFVLYEPYSGVAFQSTLYLQANYLYEPDELFTYNQSFLLPVFSINRSGNLTQQSANKLFGDLYTALKVKTVFFYIGVIILVVGILIFSFGCFKMRKSRQTNQNQNIQNDISVKKLRKGSDENYQPLSKPMIKEQIQCDEEQV